MDRKRHTLDDALRQSPNQAADAPDHEPRPKTKAAGRPRIMLAKRASDDVIAVRHRRPMAIAKKDDLGLEVRHRRPMTMAKKADLALTVRHTRPELALEVRHNRPLTIAKKKR